MEIIPNRFSLTHEFWEKSSRKKKKVLVIENDQDIRHFVKFILDDYGFETMSIAEPEKFQ